MARQGPARHAASEPHPFSGANVLPGAYQRPQGFQIQLNIDDAAAAERIFTQLADGGDETVPLQQTF